MKKMKSFLDVNVCLGLNNHKCKTCCYQLNINGVRKFVLWTEFFFKWMPVKYCDHEITKYGIHSFTQIALAVDKQLTDRQDSAPDWLNKSSRQLVICIYRQGTNKLTKG